MTWSLCVHVSCFHVQIKTSLKDSCTELVCDNIWFYGFTWRTKIKASAGYLGCSSDHHKSGGLTLDFLFKHNWNKPHPFLLAWPSVLTIVMYHVFIIKSTEHLLHICLSQWDGSSVVWSFSPNGLDQFFLTWCEQEVTAVQTVKISDANNGGDFGLWIINLICHCWHLQQEFRDANEGCEHKQTFWCLQS